MPPKLIPPIGAGFELPAGLIEAPRIKRQGRFEVGIISPISDIIVNETELLALMEANIAPKMV
jgi:hypothetical protein